MAKFGINDILNAKTKAAGQQAQTQTIRFSNMAAGLREESEAVEND